MPAKLEREIFELLGSVPKIDIHTHLSADRLMARGLDDLLLYHMLNTELYAASHLEGEHPDGARVPEDRTEALALARIEPAVRALPRIRNTSLSWVFRRIIADLYDWKGELDSTNWRKLHERIKERNAADGERARTILRDLGVRRVGTEITRRADGRGDDIFQYALEWAFFARTQWDRAGASGQADMPLFELERTWGAAGPQPPLPVTMRREERPALERTIRRAEDLRGAVRHYAELIPRSSVLATAQHLSTDIDYRPVTEAELETAIRNREHAGARELGVYASAILEAFLTELERRGGGPGSPLVFQFSLGAESLPFESACRLRSETVADLARLVAAHPDLRFMCFNASRAAHQSLCSLVRELPNLSLGGFWWHSFFPSALAAMAQERLDMVPLVKQCDYMSDAYVVDWVYGKDLLIRRAYAGVFARQVEEGQYSMADVEAIAHGIFLDSPRELLGFTLP